MSFESVMPPYNASDPTATFLNSSCLDFLLIELVPMAYRVANELEDASASSSSRSSSHRSDEQPPPAHAQPSPAAAAQADPAAAAAAAAASASTGGPSSAPQPQQQPQQPAASNGNGNGASNGARRFLDEDEEREAVFYRLEALGYRVGQGLVERFSRDRPRCTDTLDVIKFLCKDLWTLVFRKQVDNLKTNHRGVFVLTDEAFRPFSRMSAEAGGQVVVRAQPFLWFPCGIVRGALAAMGITATVQAETSELPRAIFQIKTVPS